MKSRKALLITFVVGFVLGVVVAVLAPGTLRPLIPASGPPADALTGPVVREERQPERLLLTVHTQLGALLAAFEKNVDEIDLLVDPGDSITLGLTRYRPFVNDPSIEGVQKPGMRPAGAGRAEEAPPTAGMPEEGAPQAAPEEAATGTATEDTARRQDTVPADTTRP